MKKKKLLLPVFAVVCASCLMFVGCTPEKEFVNPGDNLGGGQTGTLPNEELVIEESDINFVVDLDDLSDNTTQSGTTLPTTTTEISTSGDYILTGNYTSGIEISVGNNETTHLFLNNANISNTEGIAISNTNKKSKLIITALTGTVNTIENSGDDVNAIHVKGTLGINGSGTINVVSQSKSGIKVTKGLEICDVTLNISCQNHGISALSVTAENAKINVTEATKDGINAECDDDTNEFPENYSEGFVIFKDVNYTCSVQGDGIQADTLAYVNGGQINITTNGEFVQYSTANLETYDLTRDDFRYIKNGNTYQKVADDSNSNISQRYALAQSSKGIKVGAITYEDENENEITVSNGDYLIAIVGNNTTNITSSDDAIHTNCGNVNISDGTITINTNDDGITCDKLAQIDGGTINIQSCYEGIEGAYVTVNGGTINVVASDDGFNAASDDTSIEEYIIIKDGSVTINASGDGMDSNGSILFEGGTTLVYGPTTGGDAGIDSETGVIINGGTVVATSTLGMVETPSTNSTQYVLSYAQNSIITAGTVLSIKNANNEEILTFTVQKDCQSVIISLPDFEKNAQYTIYGNSTQLATFTISNTITSIGSNKTQGPGINQPGQRMR